MIFPKKLHKNLPNYGCYLHPGTHSRYPGIGHQVNTRVSGTRVRVVQSLDKTDGVRLSSGKT